MTIHNYPPLTKLQFVLAPRIWEPHDQPAPGSLRRRQGLSAGMDKTLGMSLNVHWTNRNVDWTFLCPFVQWTIGHSLMVSTLMEEVTVFCHPIRTLYPNKIIVSNKLLGLSRLGLGLGFGFILYA